MPIDRERLERWHGTLEEAERALIDMAMQDAWPEGIGADTIFALGRATGILGTARGLLGRDIDQVSG